MAEQRPNILLITTDQQRHDTAGAAAPSFMRTPHFDQLAREGVTFSRAYADCPLCVPSRISIMTGKTVFSHGMAHNGASSGVMGRDGTLPTLLRARGYQTAAVGKMHFEPQRARHGFDEMVLPDDYYRHMHHTGGPHQPLRHGVGQNNLYPTLATVPETLTLTSWIAEQCAQYIMTRRDPGVPFFLWCSFSKPHPPFDPPEPYYSMYRDCDIPAPIVGGWRDDDRCPAVFRREQMIWQIDQMGPETLRAARAAYYGLITQIDYNMGRLFAALHETRLYDDTLVIFTSDHGEFLGDHRAVSKTYFHEPAARVPFLLRMPRTWDDRCHGLVNDGLVGLYDILPTLLAAAGAEPPDDVDGHDLIARARGQAPPREFLEAMVRPIAQAFPGAPNLLANWGCFYTGITDGRWKYIWYPEGGGEQLFDLETDPTESNDLAHCVDFREKRDELRAEMVRRHESRGSDLVRDGRLVQTPVLDVSERDVRNTYRLACLTELAPHDIRH